MKTLVNNLVSHVSLSSVGTQTSPLLLSIIMQLRVIHEVNVSCCQLFPQPALSADS